MIFNWFNTDAVDTFTDTVAQEFIANFPPSELQDQRRKGPARLKRASDALFASAKAFVAANSPNMYQKARLGNRFKWTLKSAGYTDEFVDALTFQLTALIAAKPARKK